MQVRQVQLQVQVLGEVQEQVLQSQVQVQIPIITTTWLVYVVSIKLGHNQIPN